MNRRELLATLATATTAFSGCLSSFDEPSSTPTETATPATSTPTMQEQTSAPETGTAQSTQSPPYTFVSVGNNHDTSHEISVTITSVATGEIQVEEERQLAPKQAGRFEISDEWLTEEGRYEVNAKSGDGRNTSIEVEADESWACNHTVTVEITSDGELISNLSAGMRKGC